MKKINDYMIIEHGINEAAEDDPNNFIKKIEFEDFHQSSYEEKKRMIIDHMMRIGSSWEKDFPGLFYSLENFENLLYAINKLYRDHVFHTFRVWGLGLYFYYNGMRKCINNMDPRNFHMSWYIASVYHDVGYPILGLNNLSDMLNSCFKFFKLKDDVFNFECAMESLLEDQEVRAELETILDREFDYHDLQESHGLLGALLLLSRLKLRFHDDWNKEYGYPALRAISHHDGSELISFEKEPLSALLLICDEFQEWGRPYISQLLEEKYVTTDHIELDLHTNGNDPFIEAIINYKDSQCDLCKILKWNGKIAEDDKIKNLSRVNGNGINIELKMEYFKEMQVNDKRVKLSQKSCFDDMLAL
jgi:hypothetical protein